MDTLFRLAQERKTIARPALKENERQLTDMLMEPSGSSMESSTPDTRATKNAVTLSVLRDCRGEVTCGSCDDRFNQLNKLPRLLPCFHTVCESCVRGVCDNGSGTCPICKDKFTTDNGVSSLKINYYIMKMVQIFSLLESEQQEKLKCMGCTRSAHFRCMKCSENYCSSHAEFHQKSRATHDHNIIAVKDVASNIHSLSAIREQEYCAVHTTRSLELYCLKCDKALCSLCCITQHRTHTTGSLSSAAQRARNELGQLAPRAAEKMSMERQNVMSLRKLSAEVARDHEQAKRGLKEFCGRMIQNIKSREEEMLNQLNFKKTSLDKVISGKIAETDDRLKIDRKSVV